MQGFNIPKQITGGMFNDIVIPSIATNGYAAVWNNALHKIDWAQVQAVVPGGSSGYIQYNNAGAFGASGVYWDAANSRVGIGTASPAYKLDINGALYLAGDGSGVGFWYPSGKSMIRDASSPILSTDTTFVDFPIVKFRDPSNGYGDSLTIKNANVGIGTTSPGQKLDVNGSVNVATALVVPVVCPPIDTTTAWKVTKADGTTSVITVDTTNRRVGINTTSPSSMMHMAYEGTNQPKIILENQNTYKYSFGILSNNSFAFKNENTTIDVLSFGSTATVIQSPGATNPSILTLNSDPAGYAVGIAQNKTNSGLFTVVGTNNKSIVNLSQAGGGAPYAVMSLYNNNIESVRLNASTGCVLTFAASTTTTASVRLLSGTAPTSPNDGDIWYPSSGRLTFRHSTTSEIFATGVQATGGAATAGASYTSAEQSMIQKAYDACRAFGLLS